MNEISAMKKDQLVKEHKKLIHAKRTKRNIRRLEEIERLIASQMVSIAEHLN